MASQEGHSEGLSTRDAAMVVPPESPPFRAGRFKGYREGCGALVRIIVFGANGFLGAHVYRKLVKRHGSDALVVGTCSTHSQMPGLISLDVMMHGAVQALLQEVKPDVVIWCVKAREGQDEVRITQGGLSTLVDQVGRSSRIIFVSSDAVLPGSSGHYREDTPPVASRGVTALDHYINGKIAAERLIAEASSNFCIVRPGPIFGTRVTGGWDDRTHRMLEALGRGAGLQQPWNLVRTYSHVQDLADSLCELSQSQVNGVLHVGAPLPTSHFDFGKVLAHRAGYPVQSVRGFEISPEDAAKRHLRLDTSMDTHRATECLHTSFSSVQEALSREPLLLEKYRR